MQEIPIYLKFTDVHLRVIKCSDTSKRAGGVTVLLNVHLLSFLGYLPKPAALISDPALIVDSDKINSLKI